MNSFLKNAILLASVFSLANTVFAHSGGTDKYGCHAGSQPYHCHNSGSGASGSSEDDSGLSVNEAAQMTTAGLVLLSVLGDFSQPIMLSYDVQHSRFGVGAAFIGERIPLYLSSKTFGDSSVINLGRVTNIRTINNVTTLVGFGVHTECEENICLDAYKDEVIKFNFNIAFRYRFDGMSLLVDLDSANRGFALGLSTGL